MLDLLLAIAVLVSGLESSSVDRSREGNWNIVDTTDNNNGQREVYALQFHFKPNEPDFVTLTLRCSRGRPVFLLQWSDVTLPDHVAVTIGPVGHSDAEPAEQQYLFDKSDDAIEFGFRASPETSSKIIAAIGDAKYATVSIYPSSGRRTVGVDITGTQRAWSRVVRHCPIQILPVPPI